MNLKSLMLGATAIATATAANAADLPVAPEPVDYVRVCDAYGAKYYYIPGTETCISVGGRVRNDFIINNVMDGGAWDSRTTDGYDWKIRGYLYLNSKTETEFGTLASNVTLRGERKNTGSAGFSIDDAKIVWGNITAGYTGSNFNIYTGQVAMGVVTRDWADSTLNQIAYTAAFGEGFSATIALEDRKGREVGSYGGTRTPDLVGALAVSQGWGAAQISGALHHVHPATTLATGGEDQLGWAVGAGAHFNLPFATSGSNIFFQGFYADGALHYIGGGITGLTIQSSTGATLGTVSDYSGKDTNSGYSLSAGVNIQATSTVAFGLDGSYAHVDVSNMVGTNDASINRYAIDGSVSWSPSGTGLQIAADVGYSNSSADITGSSVKDLDELLFGVRMQHTF